MIKNKIENLNKKLMENIFTIGIVIVSIIVLYKLEKEEREVIEILSSME